MIEVILERSFDPALTRDDVIALALDSGWCFEAHKVNWLGSMLADGGRSMVCRFEAADAESIRLALRLIRADTSRLWLGTTHEVPEPAQANVVVERDFAEPADLAELQAREDAKQWCLDSYRVKFVRTHLARDRKRMLCLYSAPDSEAVRSAQREADMPFSKVWSFTQIGLGDLQR
jgi:hypothetical protein